LCIEACFFLFIAHQKSIPPFADHCHVLDIWSLLSKWNKPSLHLN
jgi:hypothetical protein